MLFKLQVILKDGRENFGGSSLGEKGKAATKIGFLINFNMTALKSVVSTKKDFSSTNKFYLLDARL